VSNIEERRKELGHASNIAALQQILETTNIAQVRTGEQENMVSTKK
jgi:hypothetical protein